MKTQAFLIRVGICLLLSLIPLNEVENQIFSLRMRLRDTHASAEERERIVIAGMDARALSEGLGAVLAQDPALVAVTGELPRAALARAEGVLTHPKVVWGVRFTPDGQLQVPPPLRREGASYGFTNFSHDPDGSIRRLEHSRNGIPSLASAALSRLRELDRESEGPAPSGSEWINYAGPHGAFSQCRVYASESPASYAGTPPCTGLNGKIVILSVNGNEITDAELMGTPLGLMSRAEVLANTFYTAVGGNSVYYAPLYIEIVLILAMVVWSAFYIIYYPVLVSAVAVTGTGIIVVLLLFQLLFHLFDIYIPTANVALSMLVSYLIFTGYRQAVQENLQWRALKQSQYLRELDEMKTNFLSLVSHDLKTPIAKIQTVVHKLKKDEADPTRMEYLESVENSTNELKNYIASILNLSKIEAQKVILNKKSNDVNRIIEETLRRMRPLASQKEIRVETDLEPLFAIECDEDLIRQVLTNLVDNAIKYSPKASAVTVRSKEEGGFIRVDVEDQGPGIPQEHLPLMFRKFSRFHRPIRGQPKGTGLGLYLSKYFINLHGGNIRLKTREGKGSVFTFTLPIETARQEETVET